MTDRSDLLGDWRVVLAGCLAVFTAGAVTLVVRTGDPATADTYVSGIRNAAVELAGGRLVDAVDGMLVPVGASVRTGADGAAELTTAGREVYLGALTTVKVIDGVRQTLDRGQVMVDSRDAPRLALDTKAGGVAVAEGALARIEQAVVLRLGVFSGEASFTAAGRRATTTVPELYQSKAPYGGLAGRPTALALTGDTWEARLVADLVSADVDLRALGRGLSGANGTVVLQSASARLRAVPAAFADRGEQALAVAVAQAANRSPDQVTNLALVQTARAEGGSWGVVAAIAQARVSAVSALLDSVLAPPGENPPVLAGGSPDLGGVFSPSPRSSSGPSRSPAPRPTVTVSPTVTPTSTPSVVDDLVTTITDLLSPSPAATPTLPIHLPPLLP